MTFQPEPSATPPTAFWQPPAEPSKREPSKSLAITSLVLGIIAFVFGAVPFISFAIVVVGLLAVVFGIIALVRRAGGRGLAIGGIITGGLGLLAAIVVSILTVVGLVLVGNGAADAAQGRDTEAAREQSTAVTTKAEPKLYTIKMVVNSDIPVAARYVPGGAEPVDINGAWEKIVPDSVLSLASVTVTPKDPLAVGNISCEIFVDGVSVAKQVGSGFVSCMSPLNMGQ